MVGERESTLCSQGFCGITPKVGSSLAGAYMVLMTNMYLIFETGHLDRSISLVQKYELTTTKKTIMTIPYWIIPYCYYVAITLAVISYPVCFYFVYCVRKRDIVGILIYPIWIVFYDISNCVIVALTYKAAKAAEFSISHLEWFGAITRILVDCFWLSFVIIYALMIIEGRRSGRLSLRTRQVSRHISEPPKFRLGARRIQ